MEKERFLNNLRIKHPETLGKIDYSQLPDSFLAHDFIPLSCNLHGPFRQKAYLHLQYGRCPTCGTAQGRLNKRTKLSDFVEKARLRFGDKFDYSNTQLCGKETYIKIICPTHGEFSILPAVHLSSKEGCQQCGVDNRRAETWTILLGRAKSIHKNFYDYSKVNFENTAKKVEIICPKHGSFWQSMNVHICAESDCPRCHREKEKIGRDAFIQRSQSIHGNRYTYEKVVYSTGRDKVVITCPKHGDFNQTPASHLSGNKCPKCALEDVSSNTEIFVTQARKIHGNYYDYSKVVYIKSKLKVEIICPKHGSFWINPNTHLSQKCGCPRCRESNGEKMVAAVLEKYGISFVREYRIPPHLYRYDFYLPDFNIFIEFHGQQHYRPVDLFGGHENFLITKTRDAEKVDLVNSLGGSLVVIKYISLLNDSVEVNLIRKLLSIYKRWYSINGIVRAYRSIDDVYREFGIPSDVPIRLLEQKIGERVPGFSKLF